MSAPRNLFSSDNSSAVDPRILSALGTVDRSHAWAYGDDDATRGGIDAIRRIFDTECDVFFVYNGTGANVVSLSAATRSHEAVICTEMAHINQDECGAPEAFGGYKLHGVAAPDGKLTPEHLRPFLRVRGFEHANQPRTISITQATEIGSVYLPEEVAALGAFAREHDLYLHMDGARIANAAVSDIANGGTEPSLAGAIETLRAMTAGAGVDLLSFGATKNGLMFGEAIVVFRRDLADHMAYIRKQATQLHSKMRYVGAQFAAWIDENVWYENAVAANRKARRLAAEIAGISGVKIHSPVYGNGVFAYLPAAAIEPLREEFGFYLWDATSGLARLMLSYDTREEFTDAFVARLKELAA